VKFTQALKEFHEGELSHISNEASSYMTGQNMVIEDCWNA